MLLYLLTKISKLQHLLVVQAGLRALVGQLMMHGAATRNTGDHRTLVTESARDNPRSIEFTTKWSGLTAPDTTASPSPGLASITVSFRCP